MTIPSVSFYPDTFDTNDNLFLVHDALRLTLVEDYNPGNTTITVDGDPVVFSRFPATGLVTLTEQCSEIDERAISFYYGAKGTNTFEQLEILDGFADVVKPKRITQVTQNVMASHHNVLKDSVINIQEFVGVEGTTDTKPLGETIEGRTNYLRNLVLSPKAWFAVDKNVGLVPFEVTFTEKAFRAGDDAEYIWDFGDQSISISISNISTICVTSAVPLSVTDVYVVDLDGSTVKKTFTKPGLYDGKLTVRNQYGEDTVIFPELIRARGPAPGEATIDFLPRGNQIVTDGTPTGGPFTNVPRIRSVVNTFIDMEIPEGINSNTGKSNAGEVLSNLTPVDPVVEYTWNIADDLEHSNLPVTRAAFSIGGIYDLILRVDTQLGAYAITTYEDAFDIIEKSNLWLWTYDSNEITTHSYEFGLLSETFKQAGAGFNVIRDDSFLDGSNNEEQAKQEFQRNTGFTIRGNADSGSGGTACLFWASGGDLATQTIKATEYNGFIDAYTDPDDFTEIARPWNWLFLSSGDDAYFLFGVDVEQTPDSNNSLQTMNKLDLSSFGLTANDLALGFYKNGAGELTEIPTGSSGYDNDGQPTEGRFAVYRSTWKGNVGYFVRNDNVGSFFKLKSFYRTEGTTADPVLAIKKLPDVSGQVKTEGQLVALSNGIYFFNNSGRVSAYNEASGVWETATSVSFRSIQDETSIGFNDTSNTLLAASDGDKNAYLSFDYSIAAFTKYNVQEQTFTNVGSRPAGTQWIMGVF